MSEQNYSDLLNALNQYECDPRQTQLIAVAHSGQTAAQGLRALSDGLQRLWRDQTDRHALDMIRRSKEDR